MLLADKVAVIYGAGAIGGAVAEAFCREGATVFLGSRTQPSLDAVATRVRAQGGRIETGIVDALDEDAVTAFVDRAAKTTGRLDISFNLIGIGDIQGTPLVEMPVDDFEQPIRIAVRSTFLTIKAASRPMIAQGSGVILNFGGSGDPVPDYSIGGLQVAFEAVEAMRRQVSSELGKHGVRVVTMRTGGIFDGVPEDTPDYDFIAEMISKNNLLPIRPGLDDVGNVAAFLASDQARTMTSATVNISAGSLIDH